MENTALIVHTDCVQGVGGQSVFRVSGPPSRENFDFRLVSLAVLAFRKLLMWGSVDFVSLLHFS